MDVAIKLIKIYITSWAGNIDQWYSTCLVGARPWFNFHHPKANQEHICCFMRSPLPNV